MLRRVGLRISRCAARAASSFKASDLTVEVTKSPAVKPESADNLPFGAVFTDHMLEIDWTAENGWGTPEIKPFQNLSLHPAASCLHYAIELFEGMKAYKRHDGKVVMFRPDKNMARMHSSAVRSALPEFDQEEMQKCIQKLVDLERDWIPDSKVASLYIRPTMIGTEPTLGVSPPKFAKCFVILCPVGPYFATGGFNPVSLVADPSVVRAWDGGSGNFKMGANYAPTIHPHMEAMKKGHQQILWLYGDEHYITEVGTMNLLIYWTNENGEEELVTPPIEQGVILPGVTRDSLLTLAREWNEFKVTERAVTMKELVDALDQGRVKEVFGAGTACVVCPVNKVTYGDRVLEIPTMDDGAPLATRFLNTLNDIQYGNSSREGWQVIF
jgi:branched-chain amino acid aminotransferase